MTVTRRTARPAHIAASTMDRTDPYDIYKHGRAALLARNTEKAAARAKAATAYSEYVAGCIESGSWLTALRTALPLWLEHRDGPKACSDHTGSFIFSVETLRFYPTVPKAIREAIPEYDLFAGLIPNVIDDINTAMHDAVHDALTPLRAEFPFLHIAHHDCYIEVRDPVALDAE